jgi:hypothetical protein
MLCPSIPIDKNKQGGRNYDSSKMTDFKKICLISNDDTAKPNQQTDLTELRRGSLLASSLRSIPRFLPTIPAPLSFAGGVLAGTPDNKITLILVSYVSSSGGSAFPGILTASSAYGINWYYVYLNCNPTWFQNSGNPTDFWCNGPNLNSKTETAGQPVNKFRFEGATNFDITFPIGTNKFWIVANVGSRTYYSTSTARPILDSNPSTTIAVQQVDYTTDSGTAARPDTRAGTFIRDAFLQLNGGSYESRNLQTRVLDTPAYFV